MKIAVCSQGSGLDAQVDSRFGRCPYFVIVDLESDRVKTIENSSLASGHGAGTGAAQLLADEGVEAVCAHHVGPNAFAALDACGITMYTADPGKKIDDIVQELRDGKLSTHDSATRSPGWRN